MNRIVDNTPRQYFCNITGDFNRALVSPARLLLSDRIEGDSRFLSFIKPTDSHNQVLVSRGRTCGADSRGRAAPHRRGRRGRRRDRGGRPRDSLGSLASRASKLPFLGVTAELPRRASHACPLSVTSIRESIRSFRPRIFLLFSFPLPSLSLFLSQVKRYNFIACIDISHSSLFFVDSKNG